MASPRRWFHLATIRRGGAEKVLAVAGDVRTYNELNSVEEWVEESSTWKAADNIVQKRTYFSAVAAPVGLICPT